MINETIKHYDMEVDFFRGFLDPYMKYTSGLFESEGEDLETATRRMLDVIIDSADIAKDKSVLEVGPGWGALIKRMMELSVDCHYTGVSPSRVQNEYIQNFCGPKKQLLTTSFESFDAGGSAFDSIVLIGSFCHLKDKESQLARMKDMLNEGGKIVIEDTFFVSREAYRRHGNHEATRYVQKEIFGFAEILSLPEQIEQFTKVGLKIVSLLEHSCSYKYTINQWIKNLKQFDPDVYPSAKDFIKYMTIAQKGWDRTTQNHLIVLQKMP